MVYEFWDMRANNLIDAFDTEDDAIRELRNIALDQGERVVEFMMLIEDDLARDESRVIGIGLELLDRARSAA